LANDTEKLLAAIRGLELTHMKEGKLQGKRVWGPLLITEENLNAFL
jgi:hypothetical protein